MPDETTWFQYIHTYVNLADEGKAKPLVCPEDDYKYVVEYEAGNDIPVLHCYMCDGKVYPGLGLLSNIRAIVKEHYV